ncbi:hypothetical protein HQ529_03955 [Candidatus Woesearchaeota archaeon]|nr:hypothetical protein [Candidatus Woesearchaeota archaeon]
MKAKIILSFVFVILLVGTVYAITEQQRDNLNRTLDMVKNDKVKYEKVLLLLEKKDIDLSDEPDLKDRIEDDKKRLGIDTKYPEKEFFSPSKKGFPWIIGFVIMGLVSIFLVAEIERKKGHIIRLHQIAEFHGVHKPHNDLNKVDDYVSECMRFGYPTDKIESTLLDKGWNSEKIQQVLGEIKLRRYIIDTMKKGYTKEQIREHLVGANWSEDVVDKALKALNA